MRNFQLNIIKKERKKFIRIKNSLWNIQQLWDWNFEENFSKKRGSLGYRFGLGHSPSQDPRWFHKIRAFPRLKAKEEEEKKGFTPEISTRIKHEAIVDGACAVYHDQAWILRDSKPWNRTPTMSRMRIPASAERGSRTGTFLFIFRVRAWNFSGKPSHPVRSPFFSIELWIPARSIRSCFFSFSIFFFFHWLFFLSCLFTAFDNGMLFLCTT